MDVVRRGERHRRRRLAHRNGDGLAVGQFYHQVRTGNFVIDRCGVGHHTTFSDGRGRGQGHGSGVDGIGDLGHGCAAVYIQLLEVTTRGFGHFDLQCFSINVDIIAWGVDDDRSLLRAGGNGDGFTVAQLDHQIGAGLVGQGRGISDLATLGNRRCRAQGKVGNVLGAWSVGHGRHRLANGYGLLVIAARDVGDLVGQVQISVVGIVWRGEGHRRRRLTHRNGNGLTVGQFHHQVRTGDLVVDRRGVGHHTTLDHALRGRQGHGGSVDGIGDFGHGRLAADIQLLEIATRGIGDGHAEVFGIDVHIVPWGVDDDRSFLLACRDGNGFAVAQFDDQVSAGLVGQGGGVGDRATFGHCRCGRKRQAGNIL